MVNSSRTKTVFTSLTPCNIKVFGMMYFLVRGFRPLQVYTLITESVNGSGPPGHMAASDSLRAALLDSNRCHTQQKKPLQALQRLQGRPPVNVWRTKTDGPAISGPWSMLTHPPDVCKTKNVWRVLLWKNLN